MTSRERVRAALNHQDVDRVPIDFGSTNVSAIHKIAYQNLIKKLDVAHENYPYLERMTRLVVPCEEILTRFQVDTRGVKLGSSACSVGKQINENLYIDDWGIGWEKSASTPNYEGRIFPLANATTLQEVKQYKFPLPEQIFSAGNVREQAKNLYENTDYAIVGSFGSTVFMRAQLLRGYEEFFVDLMLEHDIADYILDSILEIRLEALKTLIKECGEYLDVINMADDLASQTSPLVSMEVYRRFIRPRNAVLVEYIKSHTKAKVMFHCCGAVSDFIEDFIDMGIDILNPVQPLAKGMETAALKQKYGDRICFWGAIDSQNALPSSDPELVRQETKRRIDDLNRSGGYVACASHNIQADVTPECILAMYETLAGK